MSQTSKVRPMAKCDIPEVARLFFATFRKTAALSDHPDFEDFLAELLFTHPALDPERGSLVAIGAQGEIHGALTTLPTSYRLDDEPLNGRLLCTYMAAPGADSSGIGRLSLSIRPRQQQMCFSDSAAPVSVEHMKAMGGRVLAWHGLRWFKIFRPVAYAIGRARRRLREQSPWLAPRARLAAPSARRKTIDDGSLLRVPAPRVPAPRGPAPRGPDLGVPDLGVEEIDAARFSAQANLFLKDFRIAPTFPVDELEWICRLSGDAQGRGRLQLMAVRDPAGEICGLYTVAGGIDAQAHVLDILSRKGMEASVMRAILADLHAAGYAFASGPIQPHWIEGLAEQPGVWLSPHTHVALLSRRKEVFEAVDAQSIYIGGVAGEGWSRLVRDFF